MLMTNRGYTLIELMVAVGLFALIMTLASGAYLVMIGINRQTQNITAGINDLSFALETMTRNIRLGYGYNCKGSGDCPNGESSLTFNNEYGKLVTYSLVESIQLGGLDTIQQLVVNPDSSFVTSPLTDSSAVNVTSLTFYVSGTGKTTDATPDYNQPHVTITVSGTIDTGRGNTENFTIETGATMRGADL